VDVSGGPEHVLVVGAGLGGIRTVEQLRQAGYEGRISLVGAEVHPPYDRPPLSKQLLAGDWEAERLALKEQAALEDLGVRMYLGLRAVALRPGEVELADGSVLTADAIVLATGVEARRLPGQPEKVHTLRTLDDALDLRDELDKASTLLVVGAGFIGAEVASTAIGKGVQVTMVEAAPVPLVRGLGPEVGALAARLIREGGVDLRTGVALTGFVEPSGPGVAVELADGSRIEADVALVGIGGRPDLDWLADTGLDLRDGIPCDAQGRVVGLDGVWAVGDAAAWDYPTLGGRHRHEHWTSTTDQATVVARAITGTEPPPTTVPYFWSDQFGLKIQLIGRPDLADAIVPLHGDGLAGGTIKGTVVGYLRGERLVAVAGFGAARYIARYRALLLNEADRAQALEFAASLQR
jgi:NADPH-dependent 2,4-dienoyl-CoA reductase/sulfur reductase-like enzyme